MHGYLRRVPSVSTLREPEAALAPPAGREKGGPEKAGAGHGLHPPPRPEVGWGGGLGRGPGRGWVYGYKLPLLVDLDTGEVLVLRVTPASSHDSPVGRGMLWGVEPTFRTPPTFP